VDGPLDPFDPDDHRRDELLDELDDDRLFEYRPIVAPEGTGALGAIDRWRRRTAAGALLTSIARGFQQVFDPERKERIVIEQEAPGRTHEPEPVELHFDPESPRTSFVVLRPWLRRD
jgi:hypothetical protein